MRPTLVLIATLVALLTGLFAVSGVATATKPAPDHKVTICHATAAFDSNDNRKYVVETVDIASTGYVKGGHYSPPANLGAKHEDGGDIIPPYTYEEFVFEGFNWTDEGQAIWENDCVVPVSNETPTPSPKPSVTPTPEPTKTPQPSATPTPESSSTPTPKPSKTPKPSVTPTLPPTDTLGQTSNTGSSPGGMFVILAVLATIAILTTLLTPASARIKNK